MVTLNGFDFDYYEEFNNKGIKDYGYVDFWRDDDFIIRVYIDGFDLDTEYDSSPSSFNSNTGNVGYTSYGYDVVSDVDVYTEFTDIDENIYTREQFIENNPDLDNLDSVVEQAEQYTKKLFSQWWENQ